MIIKMYSTHSKYSRFGQSHFIQKYGIPDNLDHSSMICTVSADDVDTVVMHRGWLKGLKEPVPLFSLPQKLVDQGEPLLEFSDNAGNSYCCAMRDDKGVTLSFDLFHEVGLALSGILEDRSILPEHFSYSHPYVDLLEKFLFDTLKAQCFVRGYPFLHKTLWPAGRPFALCLTHDVDELRKTYQWITRPVKKILYGDYSGVLNQLRSFLNAIGGEDPYWTFPEIIELERRYNARSTFFFLEETAKVELSKCSTWRHLGRRYKFDDQKTIQLLRLLNENGWEVGLHGSFESYKDRERLREEKRRLEDALGTSVTGIRQHNLNLQIPLTWKIHEELGFSYDTTLGFNERLGFRWATCFPFHPFLPDESRSLNLLEIPLIIEDLPVFASPAPYSSFMDIVEDVEYVNGLLTVLWHPPVFNPYEYPGWRDAYEQMIRHASVHNAWVATAKEVAEWWRKREMNSFEWGYSGGMLTLRVSEMHTDMDIALYTPPGYGVDGDIDLEALQVMQADGCIILHIPPSMSGAQIEICMDEVMQ